LTGFANRKEIILRLRKESGKTDTETDRMKTNKRETERLTETQIKERVNYREGKGGDTQDNI
jgi:hypothetical protein